ncbi:hypothetical protein [Erythrobacter sp. JK5]|uniref:hypothetical protein n=1 Tax=Erythrobacter sp. JK5 TaxID=2829500 RepID=UPI001BAA0F26|nr:hypothetical protein [Erythrobacter sp. JK5]QUL39207.1 hypothetical protein KDC96_07805 [Erythrobacter sp. JK5]
MFRLSLAVATAAMLAGCAGDSGRYPSLAIRDAERISGQFTPTARAVEPVAPVASARDLAAIVDRANASSRAFANARPAASRAVTGARGTSIESDARARALVALADLSSLRSDTAIALGDLDLIAAESAVAFAPNRMSPQRRHRWQRWWKNRTAR